MKHCCTLLVAGLVLLAPGIVSWASPKASDDDAMSARRIFGLGLHQFYAGNEQDAHVLFSRAIETYGKDPRFYYFRGLNHIKADRAQHAENDFRRGAELEREDRVNRLAISSSLERIQGPQRRLLEEFRIGGRISDEPVPALVAPPDPVPSVASSKPKFYIPSEPEVPTPLPSPPASSSAPKPAKGTKTLPVPAQPESPQVAKGPSIVDIPAKEPVASSAAPASEKLDPQLVPLLMDEAAFFLRFDLEQLLGAGALEKHTGGVIEQIRAQMAQSELPFDDPDDRTLGQLLEELDFDPFEDLRRFTLLSAAPPFESSGSDLVENIEALVIFRASFDPPKVHNFLDRLAAGSKIEKSEYEGIRTYSFVDFDDRESHIALIGSQVLLLASTGELLEEAIGKARGSRTANVDSSFESILEKIDEQATLVMFGSFSESTRNQLFESVKSSPQGPFFAPIVQKLSAIQATIGIDQDLDLSLAAHFIDPESANQMVQIVNMMLIPFLRNATQGKPEFEDFLDRLQIRAEEKSFTVASKIPQSVLEAAIKAAGSMPAGPPFSDYGIEVPPAKDFFGGPASKPKSGFFGDEPSKPKDGASSNKPTSAEDSQPPAEKEPAPAPNKKPASKSFFD